MPFVLLFFNSGIFISEGQIKDERLYDFLGPSSANSAIPINNGYILFIDVAHLSGSYHREILQVNEYGNTLQSKNIGGFHFQMIISTDLVFSLINNLCKCYL